MGQVVDNPVHRRSALVRLTESGADAIDALTVREHRLLGRIGGNLTGADIGTTVRILDAMCAGLDDVDAEQADDR